MQHKPLDFTRWNGNIILGSFIYERHEDPLRRSHWFTSRRTAETIYQKKIGLDIFSVAENGRVDQLSKEDRTIDFIFFSLFLNMNILRKLDF